MKNNYIDYLIFKLPVPISIDRKRSTCSAGFPNFMRTGASPSKAVDLFKDDLRNELTCMPIEAIDLYLAKLIQ